MSKMSKKEKKMENGKLKKNEKIIQLCGVGGSDSGRLWVLTDLGNVYMKTPTYWKLEYEQPQPLLGAANESRTVATSDPHLG